DGGTDPIMIRPDEFGKAIAMFLHGDPLPLVISDWPDDICYFCQALITGPGQIVSLPGVPFQMVRVNAYPTALPGAVQHSALWDARVLREALPESGTMPANPT